MKYARLGLCLSFTWMLIVCFARTALAADEIAVSSPDELVQFKAWVKDDRLQFQVAARGVPVIETSPLIITLDGEEITAGAQIGDIVRSEKRETYPWR